MDIKYALYRPRPCTVTSSLNRTKDDSISFVWGTDGAFVQLGLGQGGFTGG